MPALKKGKVFLIGAGPGHAELITLRGVTCLKRCDIVLYDYLVNPDILRHIPETSEAICLGQHGRSRIWPQEKISERIVQEAQQGRTVARLKGGDPIVFARAAEELDALLENDIEFEIVPGITAALAAGSYAGIPITHRDYASAVALITGQETPGKDTSAIDFRALAQFPGTLVIYMGVTSAKRWSRELIRHGMSAKTPVALVRRCSWPNQSTIRCRLDQVAEQVTPYHKFPPPVIAIVGAVTNLAESLSWFQHRPLFGKRILVTRPVDQSYEIADLISEQGGESIIQPAIEISDPDDWRPVDELIDKIESFDWLVFSSANGVDKFLRRLFDFGKDARCLANARLAAIGPKTAEALSQFGLTCDLQPIEYRAESLAEALSPNATGKRFLLLRASRGREVLADTLRTAGGIVTQVIVYRSSDIESPDTEILHDLNSGRIDWVTATSSAIARSLHRLYGPQLAKTKLASISPITSETLRDLGHHPTVEATEYTTDGLLAKVIEFEQQSEST